MKSTVHSLHTHTPTSNTYTAHTHTHANRERVSFYVHINSTLIICWGQSLCICCLTYTRTHSSHKLLNYTVMWVIILTMDQSIGVLAAYAAHQCVHTCESVQCTFTKLPYMAYRAYASYLRICMWAYATYVCVCVRIAVYQCANQMQSHLSIVTLDIAFSLTTRKSVAHFDKLFFELSYWEIYLIIKYLNCNLCMLFNALKLSQDLSDYFILSIQWNLRRKITKEIFMQFENPKNFPK